MSALFVVEVIVNPSDGVVSLAAIHTDKLFVLPSIKASEIFLGSHLLFVSKATSCMVEMVMYAMCGVVLSIAGQTDPFINLFPIKLLIISP